MRFTILGSIISHIFFHLKIGFFWRCCSENLITNPKLLCLQAADILLYKATKVPVGEDQLQNVELTRKIASKFNTRFKCKLFPIPETVLVTEESSRRIKSLRHPEKKMSKSDSDQKSCIYLLDDPDTIRSKIKVAVTDVTSKVRKLLVLITGLFWWTLYWTLRFDKFSVIKDFPIKIDVRVFWADIVQFF